MTLFNWFLITLKLGYLALIGMVGLTAILMFLYNMIWFFFDHIILNSSWRQDGGEKWESFIRHILLSIFLWVLTYWMYYPIS